RVSERLLSLLVEEQCCTHKHYKLVTNFTASMDAISFRSIRIRMTVVCMDVWQRCIKKAGPSCLNYWIEQPLCLFLATVPY
ncbi:hypothetical protein J6590_107807, partial [Homalodisca vitripennis]